MTAENLPRYPIFIPSKGRWESRLTMRTLDRIGVPYTVVVEPQEEEQYREHLREGTPVITTPHRDEGLVRTRNWIWDHAAAEGLPRFWTMDDNTVNIFRFHRNLTVPVGDGTIFRVMEDHVERYENVAIAGMNYYMFVSRTSGDRIPPFTPNARVYSNMLIRTDLRDRHGRPVRNEGFYNDDTDLCLRVLRDGWATILYNAFLIQKSTTMTVKGGMTPHYVEAGRWRMAEELRERHPDVTTVTRKWNRWQHHVDYRPFRSNPLIRREDAPRRDGTDEHGMVLRVNAERAAKNARRKRWLVPPEPAE